MTQVTENDLKELKDLMTSKFEQINDKLNDLKVDMATIKEGQNGLKEKISDLSKRVDKIDSDNSKVFTTVLGALIITLIAGLIKWVAPSFVG